MAKVRKRETEDDLLKDLITEMKKTFPKEQKTTTITKTELDKKVSQEPKVKKVPKLLPPPVKSSGKKIPTAPTKRKPVESDVATASSDAPQSTVAQGEIIKLETNVDKLYELVKSNGRVSFRQASALFKVPQELVEDWANVLEEHKLVRVHYPTFGEGSMYSVAVKNAPSAAGSEDKEKGKIKPPKKAVGSKKIVVNLIALGGLVVVLAWRFGPPELLEQPVLIGGVGAIVIMILLLLLVRKRRMHGR